MIFVGLLWKLWAGCCMGGGRTAQLAGVNVVAVCFDKTAIARLVWVNWRTVGVIIARVVADGLDPGRLDGLYEIGIDEVSYRKQHVR